MVDRANFQPTSLKGLGNAMQIKLLPSCAFKPSINDGLWSGQFDEPLQRDRPTANGTNIQRLMMAIGAPSGAGHMVAYRPRRFFGSAVVAGRDRTLIRIINDARGSLDGETADFSKSSEDFSDTPRWCLAHTLACLPALIVFQTVFRRQPTRSAKSPEQARGSGMVDLG